MTKYPCCDAITQQDADQSVMSRLMFQRNDSLPLELQQVSSWDVPNLRCLPVVVNGELPDGERPPRGIPVYMDASYFSFMVCLDNISSIY